MVLLLVHILLGGVKYTPPNFHDLKIKTDQDTKVEDVSVSLCAFFQIFLDVMALFLFHDAIRLCPKVYQ